MARGNWRNWDLAECNKCGAYYYDKYRHTCKNTKGRGHLVENVTTPHLEEETCGLPSPAQ